ncbi:Protein kinase, putative [Hondaea fermentalgiana]|uniref:Protein kinase, putative n=1 Tax=Hondaea fermentalgiana TaxID=2315210 RepID=A0A2R5GAU6_9STRA|nr:Protein kinase, putative [Hondaea fermentalgiana]|eukprot:GBG27715.1 Protein kinase, putative [Hondaea fermentalgiana]
MMMTKGAILGARFEVESTVRETGASQVLACRDLGQGGRPVAIKIVRPELYVLGAQEFNLLRALRDVDTQNRIVHVQQLFVENGRTCIVMELLGDSLHDRARQTSRVNVAAFIQVAREILRSVHFVHENDIIHADIKPGNLAFLRDAPGRLKLIDFGNAITFQDASLYFDLFEVQTTRYRAPECVFGVPFDAKIDIWSTAVTLLELALGKPLFTATQNKDLVAQWRHFFGRVDPAPFVNGKFYSSRRASRKKRAEAGADSAGPTSASAFAAHDTMQHVRNVARLRDHRSAEYRPQSSMEAVRGQSPQHPYKRPTDTAAPDAAPATVSHINRRASVIGVGTRQDTTMDTECSQKNQQPQVPPLASARASRETLDDENDCVNYDSVNVIGEENVHHSRSSSTSSAGARADRTLQQHAVDAEPDVDMEKTQLQIWNIARAAQLAPRTSQQKVMRRHESSPGAGLDISTYRLHSESRSSRGSSSGSHSPFAFAVPTPYLDAATKASSIMNAPNDDDDDNAMECSDGEEYDGGSDSKAQTHRDAAMGHDANAEAHIMHESPRSQPASIGSSRGSRIGGPHISVASLCQRALSAHTSNETHMESECGSKGAAAREDGTKTGLHRVEPFELSRVRAEIHNLLCLHGSEIASSEGCVDLLARMLVFDPKRRLSAREALEHPILKVDA